MVPLTCFPELLYKARLHNIFALYDKNQDEQLSEEEVHNMLERVSEVLNGSGTVQAVSSRLTTPRYSNMPQDRRTAGPKDRMHDGRQG